MNSAKTNQSPQIFQNPVFPHSFPDPFVLKHGSEYYAYCTGHWTDGKVFGVLRSRDLIEWEAVGSAMEPVDDPSPFYWAPEVTYDSGIFYLYYSMGNETLMHLRVATSTRPDGGFVDSGRQLTDVDFAIDAHVFRDDDGRDYLFYAVDFLEHSHIGTGIVVDEMIDRYTVAGKPRPVVRAKYDWQVYDPARQEKGGVRWHTVEGPFVFKRKGRYYVMFSGGNWQNPSYGVSFATTDSLDITGEWEQYCDGSDVLPILRTYPGKLIGPGHNSVVRGPNNREIYCVYHCWHEGQRVLAVNRMDFAGSRLIIDGSPFLPKSFPYLPETHTWNLAGQAEKAASSTRVSSASFLCEAGFRTDGQSTPVKFGVALKNGTDVTGGIEFNSEEGTISARMLNADGGDEEFRLPDIAAPGSHDLLRLEVDGKWGEIVLNGVSVFSGELLSTGSRTIELYADGPGVEWSEMAVTEGFENDLDPAKGRRLEDSGWSVSPPGSVSAGNGEAILAAGPDVECRIAIEVPYPDFEFAATIRSAGRIGHGSYYAFIVEPSSGAAVRLEVVDENGKYVLREQSLSISLEMPESFRPADHHQFKFERLGERVRVFADLDDIGSVSIPTGVLRVGIACSNTSAAVEMLRLTSIG